MDSEDKKYEDGRLYDTGDKVGDLEVTFVRYQEDADGNKFNFEYELKHPDDIEKAPEHGQELTEEQILADIEERNQQNQIDPTRLPVESEQVGETIADSVNPVEEPQNGEEPAA